MPDHGTSVPVSVPAAPAAVVEHREVLRTAIVELEDALALPSFSRYSVWCAQVASVARALEERFADHVHLTEGPDGLYSEILRMAPRLEHRAIRLRNDHVEIMSGLSRLLDRIDASVENLGSADEDSVDALRREGTRVLGLLVRHRQRGIDLTYEAYRVDLGGE